MKESLVAERRRPAWGIELALQPPFMPRGVRPRAPSTLLPVSHVTTAALRASLVITLRDAHRSGLGVPAAMQAQVREYARSLRLDGVPIERAIIDVKSIVKSETADHEIVFLPRVVGWMVAGYFAGTSPKDGTSSQG